MKHTKHFIAALALLSVSSSVFAAVTTTATPKAAVPSTSVKTTVAATPAATPSAGELTTPATATGTDALNVIGAPVIVSQTATSVTLQWEKAAAAKSYIVKYDKYSIAEAVKKGDMAATYNSESDQVTSTGITITNLKSNTTYYFAVIALDAAKNESNTYSEERAVILTSTPATGTGAAVATATGTGVVAPVVTSTLKLASVSVVNDKTLTVDFSTSLSPAPVTVKIKKTTDSSAVTVVSVVTSTVMPNRVTVNLGTALSPSSSYSIVIINATDIKGLPIAEGVNATKEFPTVANLVKAVGTAVAGSGMVLNAAPTDSGATLSGAVAPAVGDAASLPPTGTQENLILLVAALLALVIVYAIQKKRA